MKAQPRFCSSFLTRTVILPSCLLAARAPTLPASRAGYSVDRGSGRPAPRWSRMGGSSRCHPRMHRPPLRGRRTRQAAGRTASPGWRPPGQHLATSSDATWPKPSRSTPSRRPRPHPASQAVLVVTDDFRLAASCASLGCEVMPDGVSEDLNATLRPGGRGGRTPLARRGAGRALRRPAGAAAGRAGRGPAARCATRRGGRAAFVRDRTGIGHDVVRRRCRAVRCRRFGLESAARHDGAGAVEVGATATERAHGRRRPGRPRCGAAWPASVRTRPGQAEGGPPQRGDPPTDCAGELRRQDFFAVFLAGAFFAGAFFAAAFLAASRLLGRSLAQRSSWR